MKVTRDNKGFSVVEALLIFVIIGIIAFVGWYVWQAKQNTDKSLNAAKNSSNSVIKPTKKIVITTAPDPYATWKTYTNADYGISFKYPTAWIPSDDVNNPDGDAVATIFSTGLKLTEARKYNNTVVVEVHDESLAATTTFYDQYYAQSTLNKVAKSDSTLNGKESVQYEVNNSGNKSKLYLFSVGTKTYSFASINEELNVQTASDYWTTFDKVFDSFQIN